MSRCGRSIRPATKSRSTQDDEPLRRRVGSKRRQPDTDFDLFYTVSEEAIGANLLSYWMPRTTRAPSCCWPRRAFRSQETAIAKDVIVVLDTSGSMEGEKIEQAKQALIYVLEHLNEGDRFTMVEFSTGVRLYDDELQTASEAAGRDRLGRTISNRPAAPISTARCTKRWIWSMHERPTYVLFLTDGLPTEGETDAAEILDERQSTPRRRMSASSPSVSATMSIPSCSTLWPPSITAPAPMSAPVSGWTRRCRASTPRSAPRC